MSFDIHQFMCPICGQKTIPIARKTSQKRSRGHRKWLYCPWCKKNVNTYECRNEIELMEFNEKFASGEITKTYTEELETMDPKHMHT